MNVCRQCGTEVLEGEMFCHHCGYDGAMLDIESLPRVNKNERMVAICLALLPGLVNVFGLGQLYLKHYFRAAIFLSSTVFLYLVSAYVNTDLQIPFTGLIIALYFIQSLDVFMLTSNRDR